MAALTIWLLTSLIGLGVTVYGAIEAIRDVSALSGISNGRMLVARQRLLAQAGRILIFTFFTLLGVANVEASVTAPPPDWTAVGLISVNILYMVIAATDVYVGWRLRQ